MIARVRVLLPFTLYLPESGAFRTQAFEHHGYQVRIFPPFRAAPATSAIDRLEPANVQAAQDVRINGELSIPANVFHVQFSAPDFDRRLDAPDPPVVASLAFDVADAFLARYRTLFRASELRLPLRRDATPYHVHYLNDDTSELPEDASRCREQFRLVHGIDGMHVLVGESWDAIASLPPLFDAPLYDKLILDALGLLPDIGPALAVACTAVEVRISEVLDALAPRSTVPADLWKWITRGNGPPRQEELNALLKVLGGRALSENKPLNDTYVALVRARNSFVHKGEASASSHGTGATARRALTPAEAAVLVQAAQDVIDWIEETLPPSERRPRPPAINAEVARSQVLRRE